MVYQNLLSIVGFHFPITSLRVVITILVEPIHTVRALDNSNYYITHFKLSYEYAMVSSLSIQVDNVMTVVGAWVLK